MRTRTRYNIPDTYASASGVIDVIETVPGRTPNETIVSTVNGSGSSGLIRYDRQTIIDDPDPKKVTKTVTQYRHVFTRPNLRSVTDIYTPNGTTNSYSGDYSYNYSWSWLGMLEHVHLGCIYPKTVNDQLRNAMENFSVVNQADSLLNIMESTQLLSGITGAYDFIRTLIKARPVPTRGSLPGSGGGIKRARKILGGSASQYLAYSFGVAPLISDIKTINKGLKTLKADLDRHIRDYSRENSATSQCKGSLKFVAPSFGYPQGFSPSRNPMNNSWWHAELYPTFIPTRIVGVRGKRNTDYQSEAFKRLDYVISRFVTTGPASFAWERIPFSFVVDWFVDLSSVVSALDNALTGNRQWYSDGWVSEKYKVVAPAFHHERSTYSSSASGTQIGLNEIHYYHREYLKPHITVGLSSKFGKKQASYMAALLSQMAANLKR